MQKLKLFFVRKRHNKGQSFMEMTLVMGVLIVMIMSMVEFGNLLNQYVNLVDAAREGARFGSNQDPFAQEDASGKITEIYNAYGQQKFYDGIDTIVEGDKVNNPNDDGALAPIVLNDPLATNYTNTDELMIYFLTVRSNGDFDTSSPIFCKYNCTVHPRSESLVESANGFFRSSLSSSAPNTGILVVEIFYRYHQVLNFLPYTIPLHAYAIMPLSAAEPTPTPCPPGNSC